MAKDPSKTEQATPKRVREAREKGNVAKSQEVSKAVSILGGLIGLFAFIGFMSSEMMRLFRHFLTTGPSFVVNEANIMELTLWLSVSLAKMLLPLMLIRVFLSSEGRHCKATNGDYQRLRPEESVCQIPSKIYPKRTERVLL